MPSAKRAASSFDEPYTGDGKDARAVATVKRQRPSLDSLGSPDNNSVNTLTSAQKTYAPGAIVRVGLRDFVTYSKAEIYLGSNLNMIIGPNGTGKSTLVCAICLGLGGKPELLGRAKDIGEFVKMGETKGTIEIELQGFPGEPNVIIGRTIYKDNKSEWSLNGVHETFKNTKAAIDKFSVQIDNLCQFLPQDKVAEFAHMSPQQLLLETERATGSAEMLPRHEKLIELHAEFKAISNSKENNDKELQKLKERQETASIEVEQFRRRDKLKADIRLLKQYRPIVEYSECNHQYVEAKTLLGEMTRNLAEATERAGPSIALANAAAEEALEAKEALKNANFAFTKQSKSLTTKMSNNEDMNNSLNEQKKAIEDAKRRQNKQIALIRKYKEDVIRLTDRVARQPDQSGKEQLLERIKAVQAEMREINAKLSAENDKSIEMDGKLGVIDSEIRTKKRALAELDSAEGRKLDRLKKLSPDTYSAVLWLRQNKQLFENEVYEPPLLTLSIDHDKVDMVEAVVHFMQALTFTCMSREDYKKFAEEVIDKRGLSVSVSEYSKTDKPKLSDWTQSCSPEQLHDLHLDGWLMDAVKGPDPVINMLVHSCNLDEVAFASRKLSTAEHGKIEATKTSDGRLVVKRYISGGVSFVLNTSEYTGSVIITSRRIQRADVFSDKGVDVERKHQLGVEVAELESQKEALASERDIHVRENRILLGKRNDVKLQKEALDKERLRMKKELEDWQKAIQKLEETKDDLERLENQPDDTEEQISLAKEKIRELLESKEAFAIKLVDLLAKIQQAQRSYMAATIVSHQKDSAAKELKERSDRANTHLVELRAAVTAQKDSNRKLKEICKKKRAEAAEVIASLSEEEQDAIQQFRDISLEELDAQLAAWQGMLDSIFGGNIHVIEQFERRAIEIQHLQEKVDTSATRIKELESEINAVRGEWEAELDALVEKISEEFSAAFSSIGCAGTVKVGKEEDYDKWCIEIRVKFRENEQLQLLTHQRQSGGERSVSTIFYLMSLQGITKAPFRVVDEINQGMDPRNERVVHSRMVDVACQDHASQYFLITPKLLPNLKYHENMVVHCIFSGPFLPNPITAPSKMGLGRLRKYAALGRRLRGITA